MPDKRLKSIEKSRLLVPTGLKETWRTDKPLLLLGTWCVNEVTREILDECSYEILSPYGLDPEQKLTDHRFVRSLESKVFPDFCAVLNSIHGTHMEDRYWKIITGSWFRNTINLLVNRVRTLQLATTEFEKLSVMGHIDKNAYQLATLNSSDATWASNDDLWNHFLTLEIISLFESGINIEFEEFEIRSKKFTREDRQQYNLKHVIFRKLLNAFSGVFSRETDALLISTYMSLKAELLLHLALRQTPKWLVSPGTTFEFLYSDELRSKATKVLAVESKDTVEQVVRGMLFKLIPVVYLEQFAQLKESSKRRNFPDNPKFIFTSNSFEYDEEFKLFCAEKMIKKTRIIYGQHGNSYGTSRYFSPSVEEETCDKFITWGWTLDPNRDTPVFMLRNASLKFKRKKFPAKLLLIELYEDHRRNTWDTNYDYRVFFGQQLEFCETLRGDLKSQLLVRLSPHSIFFGSGDQSSWANYDPIIQLDEGYAPIFSLLEDSKFVVHSYDSTGMLETLSMNIPTLAFWRDGLTHLNETAKADYQSLVDVGIIHFDPVSAAMHINSIWDNIDDWWESQEVRTARSVFCQKYARKSKKPIRTLSRALLQTIES